MHTNTFTSWNWHKSHLAYLALAGFALLGEQNLSRAAGTRLDGQSNGKRLIAMSCALIILFFVVSMTDDALLYHT